MKQYFKQLAALFCAALLLTGCGNASSGGSTAETQTTAPPQPTEKSMVTLGDSVSFGYGLEDASTERYSVLLKEKLEERDGIIWNDYNYALSGDDSSDLLTALQNGRALRLPSADVIVICIGANNLLGVYTDYLSELADQYEIDPETVTEDDIAELQEQIEADLPDEDELRAEFEERIDRNLVQLEEDLEATYQYIRERNENADIYVLNVYNPYTPDAESGVMDDSAEFYDFAVTQLDRLNAIIFALTETHDDLIPVDIAAAFAEYETPPVIGTTALDGESAGEFGYYDPHPTAEGQKIIADTVFAAMEENE